MTERNRNVLIGLFALVGMVCLAALIVLFGEAPGLFHRDYVVLAKFDVHGTTPTVRQGTEVTIAGMLVGNVGAVELEDASDPSKGLLASLRISQKVSVPKGSIARVLIPLMGQPTIDIRPPDPLAGPSPALPRDGTARIRGTVVNPLEQVLDPRLIATMDKTTQQIGELAAALTPAAKAFTDLLQRRTIEQVEGPTAKQEELTANLSTAVERLYNVLKHFDEVLGDPQVQSNVKLTVDNFRAASEGIRAAVADLQAFSQQAREVAATARGTVTKVDETVVIARNHIDALGTKLVVDADKLSRMLDHFVAVGESLARGEGTAGMFLRDPKLYDELVLTFQRLGAAASEMQALVKQWQAGGIGLKVR